MTVRAWLESCICIFSIPTNSLNNPNINSSGDGDDRNCYNDYNNIAVGVKKKKKQQQQQRRVQEEQRLGKKDSRRRRCRHLSTAAEKLRKRFQLLSGRKNQRCRDRCYRCCCSRRQRTAGGNYSEVLSQISRCHCRCSTTITPTTTFTTAAASRVDLLSQGRGGEETHDNNEDINQPAYFPSAPTESGQFQTLSTLSSLSLLSLSLPLPSSGRSASTAATAAATATTAHHRGPLSSSSYHPRVAAQTYRTANNSSSSSAGLRHRRRRSELQQRTVETPPLLPTTSTSTQVQVMDAAMVMEVIDLIGGLFDHIPYAVCGTAALIYYGYRGYRPDHVSITCPEESKEAIRCWALAKGMTLSPTDPNGFRVRTADGRSWAVAIKFMKSGFQNLSRIRVGPFRASIVTLPSIANTIARSYVSRLHTATTERQAVYAKYLTWTLRRIIQMVPSNDDQRLNPQRARDIVSREFWIPFTLSYPDTVPLFISAGLEIVDGGPLQWQAEDQLLLSRQRSSFASYNTMPTTDEDDESENTPSLRRVTKRLPPTRPLLNPPSYSNPSYSYSDSEVSSSPNFILASSQPTTPTHSRYSQFHQRTSSDSQGSARRRIIPRGVKPQVWI